MRQTGKNVVLSWGAMSQRRACSAKQPTLNIAGSNSPDEHHGAKHGGAAAAMIEAILGIAIVLAIVLVTCADAGAQDAVPARVTFASMDSRTKLVGYVFTPDKAGRAPAVVMMHGRGGAYSIEANGRYDASTLSQRHQMWGRLWASLGYVAILVDGFGPRGYPQGFPRGSYDRRPEALNEVTVRPLDAYGALGYLRTRPDVAPDSVVLQGWSNGGSATLATMAVVASVPRASATGRQRPHKAVIFLDNRRWPSLRPSA